METTLSTQEFHFTDSESDDELPALEQLPVWVKTEPVSDEFQEIYQNSDDDVKMEDAEDSYTEPDTYVQSDDDEPEVKTEPGVPAHPEAPPLEIAYKCRICKKMFDSRYSFTIHVNKHKKKCENCKCVYKTWKELETHEEFCPRRFGRTVILPRPSTRPVRQRKRPHKCSLCKRRYEKYEHLFKHQVHRCTKRYVTSKWVVKI